eukprot:TRINITY_DN1021_c0_g1_i1.p1 TRINITY_DN1021_c0_g1~~TRINITY_DN1021_c0_g1_i1.p1  ORF type:complete len:228 (-),score=30.02 TRINITY_DN1021_c0_g1_i1:1272-1955(-)
MAEGGFQASKDCAAQARYATLYEPLPEELGGRNARAASASISRLLPFPEAGKLLSEQELNSAIRNKTLALHDRATQGPTRSVMNGTGSLKKRVAQNGNVDLKGDEAKFATYKQLQTLWLSYARKVFKSSGQALGDRILRMDLHGAFIRIIRSKDPSLVGISGVLVAETANTLVLVTKKDRVVTVPKNVSIAQFTVDNHTVELVLPALCFRASERSARKIKKKHKNYF